MKTHIFVAALFVFSVPVLYAQSIPEKVQKGISLLNEGNVDGAASVLEEVIRENPQHGPARFLLGQIAMDRNRWAEAEEHLKIAVVSNPRRPHLVWNLLGKLYLMQHNYQEAKQSFDQALQNSPDFGPALVGRARAALFLNNTTDALSDLQKVTPNGLEEAAVLQAGLLIYLGREKEVHGDRAKVLLKNSEKELRSFISENLGKPEGYLALALKQSNAGVALFQIAFQLNDQNPIPFLFFKKHFPSQEIVIPKLPHPEIVKKMAAAETAFKEGKMTEAKQLAEEILQDRPMHVPAELISIAVLENEENYWDAMMRYNKLGKWLPGIPSIETRTATLAQKMEAYELAECHIRKALQVEPDNGYPHHVLASVLKGTGEIDAALKESESSIALGFQQATAYVTLGDLYYEKMEISKSISALGKAVELDPRAAENIASFALSALTTEDYAALRNILETHAKANPANIGTLYSLAVMHLNENHPEKAKEYLMQLKKVAPDYSQLYYNLGLANFRLGNEPEGREAMSRFEELKRKEREEWERHNDAHKIRLQAEDAFQSKNAKESVRLYSQLASSGLAETKDLIALARSYATLQENTKALEWFEKALKVSPYNKEALAGAAQAANAAGKKDIAQLYTARHQLLTQPCS